MAHDIAEPFEATANATVATVNATAANSKGTKATAANETSANETATNETAANETAANETAANETAANETAANSTMANDMAANSTAANGTAAAAAPNRTAAAPSPPLADSTNYSYCPAYTGGHCRWFHCDKSRGPTDCIDGKCMCKEGWCAFRGHCYPPEDKCQRDVGTACKAHPDCAGGGVGPRACVKGRCLCEVGWCFRDGKCHWTRVAGRCDKSGGCPDRGGKVKCFLENCVCAKGYLVERGIPPQCFAWPTAPDGSFARSFRQGSWPLCGALAALPLLFAGAGARGG